MKRRARTTAAVAAVLTAGAAAAVVFVAGLPEGEAGAQPESELPAATADVSKETLVDKEDHDGSLGYGDPAAVTTRLTGTVTSLAAGGSTVSRGKPLYGIDDDPVVLLYGKLPAYRNLSSGVDGADVKQFEKNLWALGYRGFTVDDEYTSATAGAVEEWQDDLGVAETGTVALGQVVYQPAAVRVDSTTAAKGDAVQPGTEILQISGVRRVATVELEVADQRLAKKGAKVDVTLPDGKVVTGTVSDVETSIETAENPAEDDTTILTVTITFGKAAPTGLDGAGVTVGFVSSQREDVLTVPVTALLALAEGGYGLEVVDGSATSIVAVETGLFADGRVEVSGGGVTEGMKVGVPE
ncbi:peptidoglycan-binding protein [Actinoplanes sp. OR16]|uniref:efflux RND transporter periplasmic adaptor subunit n=1 Tax=Actinoplanes sp. OR16 TaxID=946334 RepID=UPI000F7079F0|nr:HlyD family efflux transporter periplasmic adaptor subunit [Actinoplanes sp. OR16]BBH66455.1 peptidoglycan-binding protein [Actinoplanes sp. OR16]